MIWLITMPIRSAGRRVAAKAAAYQLEPRMVAAMPDQGGILAAETRRCAKALAKAKPWSIWLHPRLAFATAPKQAGFDAGSPHSWRSIFRDWAGDIGRVDRDLAEASLAHSLGAVEAAYRRQSAIEARRPVMEAYSRWLAGEEANVVAFKARV